MIFLNVYPILSSFCLKTKISGIRTQRRSASPRRRVVEPYPSTHVAAETEGDTGEKEGAIINNWLVDALFVALFGRSINFLSSYEPEHALR